MPTILFICTANICRSPMARGLLESLLEEKDLSAQWRVESAGTWAMSGEPAALGSKTVMETRGIDISKHRSQGINEELLGSADLVLTMERGQKEALRAEFPDYVGRIYLLSEMTGKVEDIDDPYGGTLSEYEDTADILEGYLTAGFDRIIELAS
jgi:protein-tyrosine-phosphatase